MKAFVYIWEDVPKGMFYIGAHKGDPTDGYIASSKTFLEEYHKRPSDFRRSIVSVCDSYQIALHQETKLLMKVDARTNPKYYNMHNGDGDFFCKGHSTETKRKISETKTGSLPWNLGISHKAVTKTKMRDRHWSKTGKYFPVLTDEHKRKIGLGSRGNKSCKGYHWYTNGTQDVLSSEPLIGFERGRSKKTLGRPNGRQSV